MNKEYQSEKTKKINLKPLLFHSLTTSNITPYILFLLLFLAHDCNYYVLIIYVCCFSFANRKILNL